MLSARLVLVRHGQSTYNADALLQGQADPPLSEAGRREAQALAAALPRFEHVVTSDLQRATETAALLGYPEARRDPRWREIDVADWAGRPLIEFPIGTEPAWRGAVRPGTTSSRASAPRPTSSRAPVWSCATAVSCAPRSRTSPARIRNAWRGPRTPA
jgi:hypothetical protein